VAQLGPSKNAPDKPGKHTKYPTYIQPGRRLADTGLVYDSKEHKFILAEKDKEEDKHTNVSDVYKSKTFHTITSEPENVDSSDGSCSLDCDDAEQACMQLCIDE